MRLRHQREALAGEVAGRPRVHQVLAAAQRDEADGGRSALREEPAPCGADGCRNEPCGGEDISRSSRPPGANDRGRERLQTGPATRFRGKARWRGSGRSERDSRWARASRRERGARVTDTPGRRASRFTWRGPARSATPWGRRSRSRTHLLSARGRDVGVSARSQPAIDWLLSPPPCRTPPASYPPAQESAFTREIENDRPFASLFHSSPWRSPPPCTPDDQQSRSIQAGSTPLAPATRLRRQGRLQRKPHHHRGDHAQGSSATINGVSSATASASPPTT